MFIDGGFNDNALRRSAMCRRCSAFRYRPPAHGASGAPYLILFKPINITLLRSGENTRTTTSLMLMDTNEGI